MNNLLSTDVQADIQNTKYEDQNYWNMMDPAQGPDDIVNVLLQILPEHASVFEYGAGRGRNVLPIALAGHSVVAQDIAKQPIDELTNRAKTECLDIKTHCGNAVGQVLEGWYDAFVCIRILHFMSVDQSLQVIDDMQSHTRIGGYNALIIMIVPTPFKPEYFCPTTEEVIARYAGWEIIEQNIKSSKPSVNSNGRSMTSLSILFKKTR